CGPELDIAAGLTLGWINSLTESVLTPPGKHEILRICFNLPPGAQVGACSRLRFVLCLGVQGAPVRSIVTAQGGETILLFSRDGDVCIHNDPPFSRGDATADGNFDISDPIFILGCMFLGTECPVCPDSGDANDDGILNIADPIYLLNWRFSTGAPPAPPFPDCGLDPTGDGLDDCEGFTPC